MAEYIYGKNTVKSLIATDSKNIVKIYLSDGENNKELISQIKTLKLEFEITNAKKLKSLVNNDKHQGIVAQIKDFKYYPLEEIITNSTTKYPLILILDSVSDPQNLGAILRVCDACNVDGLIIAKHNSVHLNATVAKTSTGAINTVKVVLATNISQTIKTLKDKGYWIVGCELATEKFYYQQDYKMPLALVLGSEGKGISPLVLKNLDIVVKIPMLGSVNSLNVATTAGIILYHVYLNRL